MNLALVSAFGPGSMVLIHKLWQAGVRLPVIFIDTLHHFPETLELVERARARYDLDVRVFRAAESRAAFEACHGARLWERDLERYQHLSKVEPFRRAIAPLDAYITGRRRDQAATRAQLDVVEFGKPIRINPLARSTREQVWAFIRAHEVPLTTPIGSDEPERAGRWRGLGRVECGIHPDLLSAVTRGRS